MINFQFANIKFDRDFPKATNAQVELVGVGCDDGSGPIAQL
jgi:hypothetical protein